MADNGGRCKRGNRILCPPNSERCHTADRAPNLDCVQQLFSSLDLLLWCLGSAHLPPFHNAINFLFTLLIIPGPHYLGARFSCIIDFPSQFFFLQEAFPMSSSPISLRLFISIPLAPTIRDISGMDPRHYFRYYSFSVTFCFISVPKLHNSWHILFIEFNHTLFWKLFSKPSLLCPFQSLELFKPINLLPK